MSDSMDGGSPGSAASAAELSGQAEARLDAAQYEEAVALYERALALDGARVKDWINRGLALWYLQRNEQALESYDRALALAANSALAWMNRGNVLHDLGRP